MTLREHTPPDERKLLAFHYSDGWTQWTPIAGKVHVPALIYEVTETVRSDGSRLYEGWIYDARTKEIIHASPYQSTFADAFAKWWSRETQTDPPEELLSRSGYAQHDAARTASEPRRD